VEVDVVGVVVEGVGDPEPLMEERVEAGIVGGEALEVDPVGERVARDGRIVQMEGVTVPVQERPELRVGDDLGPPALVVLLPLLVLRPLVTDGLQAPAQVGEDFRGGVRGDAHRDEG
jgi:hypothetical protein